MKALLGSQLNSASGSAGGLTFAASSAGLTVRMRRPTPRRSTLSTYTAKANLASLAQSWHQLTPSQRDAWHAAADARGSAFTTYMESNLNLTIAGLAQIQVPGPLLPVLEVVVTVGSVNVASNTLMLARSPGPSANGRAIVAVSKPISPTRFSYAGLSFHPLIVAQGTASANRADAYASTWYRLTASDIGMKLILKAWYITASGRASTPKYIEVPLT